MGTGEAYGDPLANRRCDLPHSVFRLMDLQANVDMGFSAENSRPGAGSSRPAQSSVRAGEPAPEPANASDEGYRALLDVVLQQTLLAENAQARSGWSRSTSCWN